MSQKDRINDIIRRLIAIEDQLQIIELKENKPAEFTYGDIVTILSNKKEGKVLKIVPKVYTLLTSWDPDYGSTLRINWYYEVDTGDGVGIYPERELKEIMEWKKERKEL